MHRFRLVSAVAALSVTASIGLGSQSPSAPRTQPQGNGSFSFALIGDMPYGPEGEQKFPAVIADINADRTLSFVAHGGDIKNGSSLCSDAMFSIDKPLLGTVSRRRVENFTRVETFGENDNHWLKVTVDPNARNVFVFDQRIVTANLVQQP